MVLGGSAIAGLLMTLIYVVCGSLLPAMVLHAMIDFGGGWTTWLGLREEPAAAPASA